MLSLVLLFPVAVMARVCVEAQHPLNLPSCTVSKSSQSRTELVYADLLVGFLSESHRRCLRRCLSRQHLRSMSPLERHAGVLRPV